MGFAIRTQKRSAAFWAYREPKPVKPGSRKTRATASMAPRQVSSFLLAASDKVLILIRVFINGQSSDISHLEVSGLFICGLCWDRAKTNGWDAGCQKGSPNEGCSSKPGSERKENSRHASRLQGDSMCNHPELCRRPKQATTWRSAVLIAGSIGVVITIIGL